MVNIENKLEQIHYNNEFRTLVNIEDNSSFPIIKLDNGDSLINFSSNDYLGFSQNDDLKKFFSNSIQNLGVGSGSSRLICGTSKYHLNLEEKIAKFKQTESAICFSSGYSTAIGTITSLCNKEDIIILDKLCHNSLIEGAKMSGSKIRVFPHNNVIKLENHLKWAVKKIYHSNKKGNIFILTESIFSMDGDYSLLTQIVKLKNKYGANLLLDEAHSFGVIGPNGKGMAAKLGIENEIDIHMGTFSKAIGMAGGYICSKKKIIDIILNKAKTFIYSTSPPSSFVNTISYAIELLSSKYGDKQREKLFNNVKEFSSTCESPICPVIVGDSTKSILISKELIKRGLFIPAIRYPTVKRGSERLRITFSALHTLNQVKKLKENLIELGFSI